MRFPLIVSNFLEARSHHLFLFKLLTPFRGGDLGFFFVFEVGGVLPGSLVGGVRWSSGISNPNGVTWRSIFTPIQRTGIYNFR